MSFESDVRRAAGKMAAKVEEDARQVVTGWFDLVIFITPVDKANLVGNWQVSKGSPKNGTVSRIGRQGPLSEIKQVVQRLGNYWLVNNLPYAPVAEYGLWSQGPSSTGKTTSSGYSIQAPQGMARITLQRTKAKLRIKGFK